MAFYPNGFIPTSGGQLVPVLLPAPAQPLAAPRTGTVYLHRASDQWANRPPEERYWNLDELFAATKHYQADARTIGCPYAELTVEVTGGHALDLVVGPYAATLSHYAFGQLCADVNAPAEYLRRLPADLAAKNLNHGLLHRTNGANALALLNGNGDLRVRCVTSDRYARIWNADLVERLLPLGERGWINPPARAVDDDPRARPAALADLLPCSRIKVGEQIGPAGLYASDRDMFAFLVNPNHSITIEGVPLYRGFFLENSEVGDRALRLTTFLFNVVCGNHIVWDARNVTDLRIVHLGDTAETRAFQGVLQQYADGSTGEDAESKTKIEKAMKFIIGPSKDEVLDALFGRRIATRTVLENAWDAAQLNPADRFDAPVQSAWGMTMGLTRVSQALPYTADRVELDKAAGKVLALAN